MQHMLFTEQRYELTIFALLSSFDCATTQSLLDSRPSKRHPVLVTTTVINSIHLDFQHSLSGKQEQMKQHVQTRCLRVDLEFFPGQAQWILNAQKETQVINYIVTVRWRNKPLARGCLSLVMFHFVYFSYLRILEGVGTPHKRVLSYLWFEIGYCPESAKFVGNTRVIGK